MNLSLRSMLRSGCEADRSLAMHLEQTTPTRSHPLWPACTEENKEVVIEDTKPILSLAGTRKTLSVTRRQQGHIHNMKVVFRLVER